MDERTRGTCVLLLLFILALMLAPEQLPAQPSQPTPAAADHKESPQAYSLPPDKLQKAIEYSRARYWLHFIGVAYGVAVLLVILGFGMSAKFRDWAEAASRRRLVQVILFVPLFTLANDVLSLPLGIYGQHLALAFDQSVQSWPSWLWDWTKGELIGFVISIVLTFVLYGVIRRSPKRWWFYFWLASLPILFTIIFLEPLVIEPLFFKFEPLSVKHQPLVNELERVVAKGGLAIPPE